DRVLNLMGRTHTALEYKAIIRKLRAARPDIQISSDFIVGFPGSTAVAKKLLNTGIPGLCCVFFQQCGNIKTIPRRVRFTVHSEI
ncbi:hypothetical protein ONK29_26335, partial [Salmonella enterica subsp. enterica serovar Anatum]|nr:hypothetical protein [Salmonella enterica subsp. enterica serovar Anatum]